MSSKVIALLRSAKAVSPELMEIADDLDKHCKNVKIARIVGNVAALAGTAVAAAGAIGATFLTGGLALPAVVPAVLAVGGTGVSVAGSATNFGANVVGKVIQSKKYVKAAKLWEDFTKELRDSKILEPLLEELSVDGLSLKHHASAILAGLRGFAQIGDDGLLAAKDIVRNLPILKIAFIGGTLVELLYLLIATDKESPGEQLRSLAKSINSIIKLLENGSFSDFFE